MSPIEHYFENLLTMGSDIKGEPNKNALLREVQEAVEICADYVKYDLLLHDTKADLAAMLEEIQLEIEEMDSEQENCDYATSRCIDREKVNDLIQQKIDALREASFKVE